MLEQSCTPHHIRAAAAAEEDLVPVDHDIEPVATDDVKEVLDIPK